MKAFASMDERSEVTSTTASTASTFADLGLDPRLLLALEKRQYEKPTPVQVTHPSSS